DNPYVDLDTAVQVAGNRAFKAAGELAQRKSIVLLKNGDAPGEQLLPFSGRPKVYVENMAPEVVRDYPQVVPTPAEADFAILRLQAPFDRRVDYVVANYHTGDLDFPPDELAHILAVLRQVPTIVDIYLDRPAVIPEIARSSAALIANFGA